MKTGGIYRGTKPDAFHKIVYLKGKNYRAFIGAVLTHAGPPKYSDNVLMRKEHFERVNEKGRPYEFKFDCTHLVKHQFLKLEGWGPFTKVGELTKHGIAFVQNMVGDCPAVEWDDYVARKHRCIKKAP
jgi:hypothetical protein